MIAALAWTPAASRPAKPAYEHYQIGAAKAARPSATAPGLLLVGGGDWDYGAFRWFAAQAGHGHIVVLRASGAGEAGEEFYNQVGGVASVETLVFHHRSAASDPAVLAILAKADGIFLAGGDQANYVNFWKGTAVARLLDDHVRKGKPIGGTSAGLAILGGIGYGALDGGSIDSPAALADPGGAAVTLVGDFLHMPRLAHVVTDTHFSARDRLGRLIAFLAKARQVDPEAIGLGVDEGSALCVEADGTARLHTPDGGFAWLVEPQGRPALAPGMPLDWRRIRITGVGADSILDLGTMRVTNPAFSGEAEVRQGVLVGAPGPGPAAR
ncbi:peptidase [Sphingosinicella sp. BN140058]|nr:peptidase [Sphingosinicella sp. BN140058]